MSYITKTIRVVPNFAAQRKMESTLTHVSSGWFPLDPTHLQHINEKLQQGLYENNPRALLEDVKNDLSLLTHAAKYIRARIEEPVAVLNPLRDLRFLSQEDLEQLFHVSANQISKHRLSGCGKTRAQIIKNGIIAANTTEVFAREAHEAGSLIDIDTAFSSAAFHQVGWNLLSWNYPDLVSRTLRSANRDRNEAAAQLKQVLGIGPTQISAHFASSWLFEPVLEQSIGGNNAKLQVNSEQKEAVRILSSLKNAAESFAAMETGMASKKEESDWKKHEEQLRELIPHLDLSTIEKKVAEKSEASLERLQYQTSTRRSVAVTQVLSKSPRAAAPSRSLESNRHLQKCSEDLKEIFKPIYDAIHEAGACVAALESLVKDALPAAGFSGGYIYLLDPMKANLVPAVTLGHSGAANSSKFRALLETAALESFGSSTPIRKQEITDNGDIFEHVCAAFGDAERPGVLLLEVSERSAQRPDFDSALLFKVVRQCLHHCLDMHPIGNE